MNSEFNMNLQLFGEITTDAETGVVKADYLQKAREVDLVLRFTHDSLKKLIEALGVTRKIPMMEGTTLYCYQTAGELQSGTVGEGEVIPLSTYGVEKIPVGEITLEKWRKAVTAEAIKKSGYAVALQQTDQKMLKDIQKGIRTKFFDFLTTLTDCSYVGGATVQEMLAKSWGKLQVLFEDDAVEAVHFLNPQTVAEYLATATVTTQTAFGMSYIEDFLGLGTVIMNSRIPKGQVYSTAKDNLIMYYLTMNGDVASAFNLTTDETGYIGMHTSQTDSRAQIETVVMSGIQFLVEYGNGVVLGTLDPTPTLQEITVESTGTGASSGKTKINLSGYTLGEGESYVYKQGASAAPTVEYGDYLSDAWKDISNGGQFTPTVGYTKVTVAAKDANSRAQAAGSATIVINGGSQ